MGKDGENRNIVVYRECQAKTSFVNLKFPLHAEPVGTQTSCKMKLLTVRNSAKKARTKKRFVVFDPVSKFWPSRIFKGVLISLRQRIRSRELAHGQDGHPRVRSRNKDAGTKCHFFGRAGIRRLKGAQFAI